MRGMYRYRCIRCGEDKKTTVYEKTTCNGCIKKKKELHNTLKTHFGTSAKVSKFLKFCEASKIKVEIQE